MTYKLNPEIGKIISPVTLILPDGEKRRYGSGTEAATASFDRAYVVDEIRAVQGTVEIKVREREMTSSSWTGEEQTFF